MKKIKYSIEYHNQLGEYILWKEKIGERSGNVIAIYKGTKKECEEKLKEIKTSSK